MKLGDRTCWEYRHQYNLGDANVSERGGRDDGESERGRGGGGGLCMSDISLTLSHCSCAANTGTICRWKSNVL